MPPLRLAFLGSDAIALPLLDWLAGDGAALAEVAAVYTQPDRPSGRGQRVAPNAIKAWALSRGLPVHQPEKITPEVGTGLAEARVDLALVMAYGHILRDEFIAIPRLGTLNLHASILPKYRGASPIQTAIASGERETGVTLMRIVRRLDAGPVAEVERVPVGECDTAVDVEAALARASVPLLRRTLPRIADGTLEFRAQDEAAATYCRKLERADGGLDFSAPATVLAARINGLFPWPACSVDLHGVTVKLGLATARDDGPANPGVVLGADGDALQIGTGRGVLCVRRLQRPGSRMLPAAEYLRGSPVAPGTVLVSRPMPELVSAAPFRR